MANAEGGDAAPAGIAEMVAALTGAFQNLSSARTMPAIKLSKFKGQPLNPGDLSLHEWIIEFEEYSTFYKLTGRDKAQALLTHLTGAAKEEILCREAGVKEDSAEIIKILKLRFGPGERVQSLSTKLHEREQLEGETLADFSGTLIRLYDRMEAAASGEEKEALTKLKDSTLKERLVTGVRDKSIQRELRRIIIASKDKSFLVMREEVMELFQDQSVQSVNARVREVSEVQPVSVARVQGEDHILKLQGELNQLKEMVQDMVGVVKTLKGGRSERREETCYNCGRKGHVKRDCRCPTKCHKCGNPGHMQKDCPQRNQVDSIELPAPQPSEAATTASTVVTPGVGIVSHSSQLADNDVLRSLLIADSPTAKLIIGGRELGCILDTGAETSLIPLSCYQEVLRPTLGVLGGDVAMKVVGVTGMTIPIVGYLKTTISLFDTTADVGFFGCGRPCYE
ncbi:uncharacterized protein [Antedon mediterranea]|uniref:uncharacterized protein n=1 Tax=Antedon mediterranea TaxID=105859 RepID=UPI003AF85A7E